MLTVAAGGAVARHCQPGGAVPSPSPALGRDSAGIAQPEAAGAQQQDEPGAAVHLNPWGQTERKADPAGTARSPRNPARRPGWAGQEKQWLCPGRWMGLRGRPRWALCDLGGGRMRAAGWAASGSSRESLAKHSAPGWHRGHGQLRPLRIAGIKGWREELEPAADTGHGLGIPNESSSSEPAAGRHSLCSC